MKYARKLEMVLVIILLGLMIYAVHATQALQRYGAETILGVGVPKYHYVVVTDDTTSLAWTSFMDGLREQARKNDAVVEIMNVPPLSTTDTLDPFFQLISLSKADGVLLRLSNNQAARDYIEKSHVGGVRMITVGNDSPESGRDAYVGTNKYELGRTTAGIVKRISNSPGRVLLIMGPEYANSSGASSNSFLNGIRDYNAQYPCISSLQVAFSDTRRAELIIEDQLNGNGVDTVICTDPLDSLRVTKTLIDRNKVGVVKVIASGELPEIVQYILKRTIQASVVEDYKALGIQSANTMNTLLHNVRQSGYVNIPIRIMDVQNAPR